MINVVAAMINSAAFSTKLFSLICFVLIAGCDSGQPTDASKPYDLEAELANSSLSEEKKSFVSKVDQWVFGAGQDNVRLRLDQVPIYEMGFSSREYWARGNNTIMDSVVFRNYLFSTKIFGQADLILINANNIKSIGESYPDEYEAIAQVAEDVSMPLNLGVNDCLLFTGKGDEQGTTIVLFGQERKEPEQFRNAIACINKGIYYHVGFLGVMDLPKEYFAVQSKKGDQFWVDLGEALFPFASYVLPAEHPISRSEYLTNLIEHLEALK